LRAWTYDDAASEPALPGGGDFWIYGLRVRSEIDLPGWPAASPAEPDVTVRREPVPGLDLDGPPYSARSVVEDGELRLAVRGVGRYSARGGAIIGVDADPGARGEDLRLYLTGVMMGTILHQRGSFPLHASCVALPSADGVAFAGRSGAGKSTLVAAMVRRGARFVSDDLCVMVPPASGQLRVWPGAARLKLDEAALSAGPGAETGLEPAGGNRGKYHLPMDAPRSHESPIPLGRVYILTDGAGPPRLERLSGLEAVAALVDETYFVSFAQALGLIPQVFRLAAVMAQSVRVSRLIRPRGLEYLPETAALIEQDEFRGESDQDAVEGRPA